MIKSKTIKPTINIPFYGPITIGAVPSSGTTVSPEKIVKEFKRAARSKLVPPPQVFNTASE